MTPRSSFLENFGQADDITRWLASILDVKTRPQGLPVYFLFSPFLLSFFAISYFFSIPSSITFAIHITLPITTTPVHNEAYFVLFSPSLHSSCSFYNNFPIPIRTQKCMAFLH